MKTSSSGKPYPSETDHFVLAGAPELIPIYGENSKELHVMLPSALGDSFDDFLDRVFPQYYKLYRKSGLYCKGNGETANRVNVETGVLDEVPCPCELLTKESPECRRCGIFRFRITELASFQVFQLSTSSFNSLLNLNSFCHDLCRHCLVNRVDVSQVHLILRRTEQEVQRLEKGGGVKKSRHGILSLDLDPRYYKSLDDIRRVALLSGAPPAPRAKELPPPDETRDELLYPEGGHKPDPEEFPPDGAEREPGEDDGNGPPPAPLTGKGMFDARLEELKRVGGILSKEEIKGNKTLKTDGGFRKAADYYERRIVDIRAAKGRTEG
jgi:hypothetical protein